MQNTHTIFVPGHPAPQGSKKHVGRGIMVEASKKLAPWRAAVAYEARKLTPHPAGEAVILEATFVMPRPKAWHANHTAPMVQRPDLDKLARGICDALTTGGAIVDDSQITRMILHKRRAAQGEPAGVHITLTTPEKGYR